MYFSLHVRTSSLRRARTRLHTIELVIVVARTGERVMEITHKADYGFLAARARKSGFIALTKKGEKMEKKMVERKKGRFFRTMNIVNERNLDKRFRYRSDAKKGVYEEWITVPMCVSSPSGTGFNVDIKDPATGMKRIKGHKRLVRLGRKILNVGVARKLRLRSMTVGQPHCNFGEDFKGGVFYTDAQGKKLVKGPGPAAIRQFIKPGFSISLNGNYELGNDKWFGLFEKRERGFRSDSAFGLDPLMN